MTARTSICDRVLFTRFSALLICTRLNSGRAVCRFSVFFSIQRMRHRSSDVAPSVVHSGTLERTSQFRSCTVRNLDEWCISQVCLASENGYRFITSFGQKMTTIKKVTPFQDQQI
ncbi:hypothetical protein AVEN_87447-1 [Araneus ventricosus]|uniref:Uncharacterized protein n=1 Tax=Araneus ventricosus TaxID=182803 RepID=A0A4Y2WNT8_ARAVE|nr:hypothetical protein AVEN_87447-1 [Araneus ventricosus]